MKNSFLLILKILVSVGLLVLILLKVDVSKLTASIQDGDMIYLSFGLIIGCIFNMVKFLKWHHLIKTRNLRFSYRDASKSYMIGNCLGLVTPLRAGDLGRALYFLNEDRPRIMGLTVIDRVIDITAVLMLSLAGSFYLLNKGFSILIFLLLLFCLFVLYSHELLWNLSKRLVSDRPSFWRKLGKVIDMLKDLDDKTVSMTLILSLVAFLLVIIQFYFLISAFEPASVSAVCLVTPLITLSSVIPVSFMGLGVREGIAMLLFAHFGISGTTAISAAFLVFIMNNVLISIIGMFFLSRHLPHKTSKITQVPSSGEQE